jgi:MFS family permease
MRILTNERAVAPPGFNRWLIPPAVLAVHLSIGQVYALSIYNEPFTRLVGITATGPDDWTLQMLAPLFVVAISILGVTTTVGARWIEQAGPRAAMFLAACCFGGGLLVAALGTSTHQLWLLYLGYGVLGGIGLGLGYVAPVSALIRWFPDRRGMASGMAIMGFGGGAMIAIPLTRLLMDLFASPTSVGVSGTLLAMAAIYFVCMSLGALTIRVPPPSWAPEGLVAADTPQASVGAREAMRTPQFYLLWVLLCMNVTSGIELLARAPEAIMATFPGTITIAAAGGFVGLLGLFNMSGRLIWSICSDFVGRKTSYTVLLFIGALFYASVPYVGSSSVTLFVVLYVLVMSIYGGCFAMIPAYISDLFGTRELTCIHGRLLSAWSVGVICSYLIDALGGSHVSDGIFMSDVDAGVLYLPALLLLVGLVSNLLIRPVSRDHWTDPAAASDAAPTMVGKGPAA